MRSSTSQVLLTCFPVCPLYAPHFLPIGWNDLTEDVTHFTEVQQAPFTKLVPSLKDMDPDDAFSAVSLSAMSTLSPFAC